MKFKCNLKALKCVKTQELFRPQVKNYGLIDFTLTYIKCVKSKSERMNK